MVVALIGYRGTGKSTVARLLALQLGCDWVDADVEVELRAGKSIAAIFADEGEQAFRDLEVQVVAELCQGDAQVVALGGGAVVRSENRKALAACDHVVWLQAPARLLAQRIDADPNSPHRRPNLTPAGGSAEVEQLLRQREPFYRECATLAVDTEGKDPQQIVAQIVAAL